jgi:hypothetical protein
VAGSLSDQLILPGGASSLRFTDVVKKPASEILAEGATPPPMGALEPITVESVRALELIEAQALIEAEDGRRTLPRVPIDAAGVMRTRHHAIARLLASGCKPSEIGRMLSVTPASIQLLERSPAFQALLLEYMAMMDKSAIETRVKLEMLNSLSVDALITRMADPAEVSKAKTTEILEIVKVASDRTGLGPTSKNITLNGRITPADIRALKDAAATTLEADASEWSDLSGIENSSEFPIDGESKREQAAEAGSSVREGSRQNLATQDDLSDILPALDFLR